MEERKIIWAAVASGLVTGVLAYKAIEKRPIYCPRGEPGSVVLAALRPLLLGSTVCPEALSLRYLPEETLPPLSIEPDEALGLMGRPLLLPMEEGEPLTWNHVGTQCPKD